MTGRERDLMSTVRLGGWEVDYLEYLRVELGRAERTLRSYEADLRQFDQWCTDEGLDPLAVQSAQLRRWLAALERQGCGGRTRARKLSTLRGFYRRLMERGRIANAPTDLLKARARRPPPPPPPVFAVAPDPLVPAAGEPSAPPPALAIPCWAVFEPPPPPEANQPESPTAVPNIAL